MSDIRQPRGQTHYETAGDSMTAATDVITKQIR